jgi:hypothetical protein
MSSVVTVSKEIRQKYHRRSISALDRCSVTFTWDQPGYAASY